MPRYLVLMLAFVVWVITIASPAGVAVQTATAAPEPSTEEVAEQVEASVVTVYTYTPGGTFSPGATGREPSSSGSGWVYSDDGLVVTNAHVIAEAEDITVVLHDRTMIPATLVGSDWYQDVAVLQLDADDDDLPPTASVGDSAGVQEGDEVFAIGTPHGQFANTVSAGTVHGTEFALNTGVGYTLFPLIQHSATLAPGNSGGPLFSMNGEVIGMNVARISARTSDNSDSDDEESTDAIGLAIDGNTVVTLTEEIIETGSVARPYLGVLSEPTPDGQLVNEVEPDSPAAEAGIETGDLVVAIDGEPISATRGFIDTIYRHEPGDTVTLIIERDDEQHELDVVLQ